MSKAPTALDIKSANLYALRVVLHDTNTTTLTEALNSRMAEAGSLFENEPVIIDASRLPDDAELDWIALSNALRGHKLPPIGIVADEDGLRDSAAQAGLAALELSTPTQRSTTTLPSKTVSQEAVTTPTTPCMVVSRPLRSGQRIYANGGDLVIVGMVSQGAEVIADGNIHVYGPLRGKAMAGARGNTAARIFTTHLDPELLAIAGIYRVVEHNLPESLYRRCAQIQLQDNALEIKAI